jgi:lipoprotein-anchoring transpeptidase ErfK/SrfK
LVRTKERKLYFILPGGEAIRYRVGVGREGFSWSGKNRISRKAQWPDWRPPTVMIEREAERGHIIPDFMKGGTDNPLGARAMYIGSTDFRIHGTTQPWSIGHAVSSGCIRMLNEHVIDLYDRVKVGADVIVE